MKTILAVILGLAWSVAIALIAWALTAVFPNGVQPPYPYQQNGSVKAVGCEYYCSPGVSGKYEATEEKARMTNYPD